MTNAPATKTDTIANGTTSNTVELKTKTAPASPAKAPAAPAGVDAKPQAAEAAPLRESPKPEAVQAAFESGKYPY
jgi:hypothetical protein